MQLSEHIKNLRTSKNLTQSELAELLQVTKSTISSYESGVRQPSYDVLIKMSKIFHVSIDYLLGNSSTCVIDVTGLNDKQRNTVQEIIDLYKINNTR